MTDTLPTTRTCPFDPPPSIQEWALARPISPLRYPDGSTGWLVTGYTAARQVLSDARFSSRLDVALSPIRGRQNSLPGAFAFMDPPEHTRYRKLLTGQFTVRRMRLLEPMIAARIDEVLSSLTSPADLVRGFALPVASGVICDLLGVPYANREAFKQQTHDTVDPERSEDERNAAGGAMYVMLAELVRAKRAQPADDLLSGLMESDLSDEEITGIGLILLFAGHETSANMLALGTFALLEHPAQLAALRSSPDMVDGAVEELLRYLSIAQYEVNRGALEDVEVAGQLVRAGESLLVSLPMANRDPARFSSPGELDISRPSGGHLAFGHGLHQCLGQQLARIELRLGFTALLARFPHLRLAIPAAEVPLNTGRGIYGVAELPVTW
ncbi:cytochrome P450 [Actinophytocola sediminis]